MRHGASIGVVSLLLACSGDREPEAGSGSSTSTSGGVDESSWVSESSGLGDDTSTGALPPGGGDGTAVDVTTSLGTFAIRLETEAAPITTANFLAYVDAGFYDGSDGGEPTIIHRVQPGRLVQGGGLTAGLATKTTMPPIVNESDNGLRNVAGAVAMARIPNDPNSATSQFFINLVDNADIDAGGFAVFGYVTEGMEVVKEMSSVATESRDDLDDVPVEPIVISRTTRR